MSSGINNRLLARGCLEIVPRLTVTSCLWLRASAQPRQGVACRQPLKAPHGGQSLLSTPALRPLITTCLDLQASGNKTKYRMRGLDRITSWNFLFHNIYMHRQQNPRHGDMDVVILGSGITGDFFGLFYHISQILCNEYVFLLLSVKG